MKKISCVFILLLALESFYLMSMPPAFKNNDSPETITAAVMLGIQHPPAYPLYTVLGKAFSLLPAGSPAFRINFLSVILLLLLLFLTYAVMETLDPGRGPDRELLTPGIWGAAAAGISFMIWNQGIEAKGGIYILNILLGAAVVFSCFKLLRRFQPKYLYLAVFAFGLSLTGQWPSALLMAPVLIYMLYTARAEINIKRAAAIFLLLCTGVSAYLYLPARMFTTGLPAGWDRFWWIVLRKGYPVLTTPGPDFAGQLIRTLNFYAGDLTPAILFVIPGIFYIFRVNRKVFYVLSYLFAADTAAAVIYNGMRAEPPATMATFILPGIYAAAIYAAAGIYYCLSLLKGRVKAGAAAGAALIIVFAGWANFDRNNLSLDFTAYDHGENILKTMGKNAVYIAAGDVNLAPLYYLQYVEKQRPDVEITSIKFLNTKFGHDEFLSLHPDARLKAGATQENAAEIIRYFSGTRPVYWAGFSIAPAQGIKQSRCGMLFTAGEISNNDIYKIYSYRGTGYR